MLLKKLKTLLCVLVLLGAQSCTENVSTKTIQKEKHRDTTLKKVSFNKKDTNLAVLLPIDTSEHQVPVLCYHRIKNSVGKKGVYTVSETEFAQHLKMLYDSGYRTILPDQLYQYLTEGKPLPVKPVILSFDDTHVEQYTVAAREMKKYGFKGVFFIMNISIGKPGYMSTDQIKSLSDSGHVIGCHTWDHHRVKELKGEDWNIQIGQPKAKLEKITGKPVAYFSYPFGVWNDSAIIELKKRGIKAAFQLTGKISKNEPLYTIRRMIVPGSWSAVKLQQHMKAEFK